MWFWLKRLLRISPRDAVHTDPAHADPVHTDQGADAFWRQAEKDAYDTGLGAASRQLYARLLPSTQFSAGSKHPLIPDDAALRETFFALCADLERRHGALSDTDLVERMDSEVARCIGYWEDGSSVAQARAGLRQMAGQWPRQVSTRG